MAKPAVSVLSAWIEELGREPSKFLFPNARGDRLSADAVQHMVAKHVALARRKCPSLVNKRVSPHVLRHEAARELLQAGVDRSFHHVIVGLSGTVFVLYKISCGSLPTLEPQLAYRRSIRHRARRLDRDKPKAPLLHRLHQLLINKFERCGADTYLSAEWIVHGG